jgi:hypothetical protein
MDARAASAAGPKPKMGGREPNGGDAKNFETNLWTIPSTLLGTSNMNHKGRPIVPMVRATDLLVVLYGPTFAKPPDAARDEA